MTIDKVLKSIRKELNISQETLARELNVSFATLNRWENKKAKPSRLAMDRIKDYSSAKGLSVHIATALEHLK
jgi:DNA-binding transcriptional regulator YiaG